MKYLKNFNELESKNESFMEILSTIVLGGVLVIQLLLWIINILSKRMNRKNVKVLIDMYDKYRNKLYKIKSTDDYERVVTVNDFVDRYYLTFSKKINKYVPNIRVLKNEKILILNAEKEKHTKIELTNKEYQEFMDIINKKKVNKETLKKKDKDKLKSAIKKFNDVQKRMKKDEN